MKFQSFAVRSLKNQIAATLKLIGMGVKKYILQLLQLEAKLEEAMSEQLDSFNKLKEDVISQLNEAAWRHLQKWACDPYRRESNEWWYLSKLRPESQAVFKDFQDRYEVLELKSFKKDEEKEATILASLPEISEEEKCVGFGFFLAG